MNALSGSFSFIPPLQLLRTLQSVRATGRLEIRHDQERVELFVVDGRSVFTLTTSRRLRLGDVLVQGGEVRPEAVELGAAFQQDSPGMPIGRILLESGAINVSRLREAVLEVQRRTLLHVLAWGEGEFQFHPGERGRSEDIMIDLDLDRLAIEAIRHSAEPGGDAPETRAA